MVWATVMTQDEEEKLYGKRVVRRGPFFKRLEGDDRRIIWDPADKAKFWPELWKSLRVLIVGCGIFVVLKMLDALLR